jgi:hypothetical protein
MLTTSSHFLHMLHLICLQITRDSKITSPHHRVAKICTQRTASAKMPIYLYGKRIDTPDRNTTSIGLDGLC